MDMTIIPAEVLDEIRKTNKEILEKLKNLEAPLSSPEYLTREEFMTRAKIGPTLMNTLITKGKIKVTRYGKKILRIPYEELLRFQRGEVQ